jgi:hypothetical protein
MLGCYELPAFAVVRGRCCPSPAHFEAPAGASCPSLAAPLDELAAAVSTPEPDVHAANRAIAEFAAAAICASEAASPGLFGPSGPPRGDDPEILERTLVRARSR